MHIHLRRVAFWGGEGDFVAFLHQGANGNRQVVEIVASAGVDLAVFQGQAATARDQHQDFSFRCHFVLLSHVESVPEIFSPAHASYELLFRGSSFALTYSNPSGPIAVICMTYSPDFAQWKWEVLPGRMTIAPGG